MMGPINFRFALLFGGLIQCFLLGTCLPKSECSYSGMTECQIELRPLKQARFEVVSTPQPFHRSETLWMAQQTQPENQTKIAPKWDDYLFYASWEDQPCVDQNGTYLMNDGCQRCNFCTMQGEWCDREPYWQFANITDNSQFGPTVMQYEGFIDAAEPQTFLEPYLQSGCPGGTNETFVPERNASYSLLVPVFFFGADVPPLADRLESPLDKLKVFVLEPGLPQTVQYEMYYHGAEPAQPSSSPCPSPTPTPETVLYRWSVRGDPVWEDNFTHDIRVTKVRILTGTPGTDPTTGRFRLNNEQVVRPSRILFLKNFSGGNPPFDVFTHPDEDLQRCYADTSTADGNFFLLSCRNSANGTAEFIMTPVHQKLFLDDIQKLTWIAEFRESEGADFNPATACFDPVPMNPVLVIEFTIERIPTEE